MFFRRGSKSVLDESGDILKVIEKGKPISPKHEQPASIEQDGFESFIKPADRTAFELTRNFCWQFNRFIDSSNWRIQERKRVLLTHYDDPAVGRNYRVFYNTWPAGRLSLEARSESLNGDSLDGLYLNLEVEFAQLYSYREIHELLHSACAAVTGDKDQQRDFSQRIDRTLIAALWDIVRYPDAYYTIEFFVEGSTHTLLHWDANMTPD